MITQRTRLLPSRLVMGALTAALVALTLACGDEATNPAGTDDPSPRATLSSREADIGAISPLMTVYGGPGNGTFPSDQPGLAVADFNGDGLDDFAAGARSTGTAASQLVGAVHVVFGSEEPPTTIDLAEEAADVTIRGPGPLASLGFSAAAGDLNGDGVADLVVGAPFTTTTAGQVGTVHILFGPLEPGEIDLSTSAADVTLSGEKASGFFGDSLATGDVNGDGIEDLVVGSTFAAERSGPAEVQAAGGAAFVFLGRPQWPPEAAASEADVAFWGEDEFDELGDFVLTGDLNGDGRADIIATAEAADGPDNARSAAGQVHILYGSDDLRGTYRVADGDSSVVIYGALENNTLGFSLAAGDLDGDGVDDLAMSARGATAGGREGAGLVYVLRGRGDLPAEIDLAKEPEGVSTIAGASTADLLATSMAIADVSGGGRNSLVLGGSFVDTHDRLDAGTVYVITATEAAAGGNVAEIASLAFYGSDRNERLGSNVAVGDVNGDGGPELVIIAETAAGPDETRPEAGRIYVITPTLE